MNKIHLTEADKTAYREQLEHFLSTSSNLTLTLSLNAPQQENVIKPIIKIKTKAYYLMKQLVNSCSTEIGFHALMNKEDTGIFTIYDILIYPQKVSGTYIDVDEQAYSEWQDSLTDEQFNHLRGQIHSHVNMLTTPSGTDEEHYEKIINLIHNNNDFYLFLILNKRNEIYARFYDFEQNTIFDTTEITLKVIDENETDLTEFVKNAIKNLEPLSPTTKLTDYPGSTNKAKTYYDDFYDDDPYIEYYKHYLEAPKQTKRKKKK